MSWFRRSLFDFLVLLMGMVYRPSFDYRSWLRLQGIEADCEPRFPLTEFDIVDGRMGWQWLASVKGYLDWRSGRDWKNWRQRKEFAAETEYYVRAINFLNTEVRHFGDAIPHAVQKKKPESVKAARSAKAGAQ